MAGTPHHPRRRAPVHILLFGSALLAGCALLAVALAACSRGGGKPTAAGPSASATAGARTATPTGGQTGGQTGGTGHAGAISGTYVALGDSFTAAPLAHQQGGSSAGCLRSAQDYPALVAAALRPWSFVNVSCFGASTADMSRAQQTAAGPKPPQLGAVSAADALVTVQVGGDDIGVGRVATTCAALSLTSPFGNPCREHYTAGGTDQLARAVSQTGPKVASVLAAIRQRAPHARIVLVGYPQILPAAGNGCWPEVAVSRGDVPYLRGIETQLNAVLAAAAAAHGVTFVNIYAASAGHDACQHAGTKWVEGLIPTSLAIPLHPNALGEQAMAREILAAVG
jgi:lysophospholipase L1-like esterase